MLSYRESKNFLWYTSERDELGRGSFGTVFRGLNRTTGEPVAVKVPHSNVVIPEEIEGREIEVCERINHINIVKLLGYEEEKSSPRGRRERTLKIIVMELCDGGSLLKILEHPRNHFGLEEDEFLTVLRDITGGMKYLRENDIIHRDLKPANIMRCIAEDGSSIYKITDFGAARELSENQEYSSIFGTEEYLHPDVYEQALLPETAIPNKKFSPSTDLWSIGATLYHVATGMLPFRPNGGRKNRQVMHLMTTKKTSGVISAYQMRDENSTIVFEKQLPKHCLLSPDLKKLICPLLAGLMEVDPRRKLSFEEYFRKVDDLLNMKQLHLFHINNLQLMRLYVNPRETKRFQDLKVLIESHTKIGPQDQILLFKDSTLGEVIDKPELEEENVTITKKLPPTCKNNPVILCNRTDTEVCWKSERLPLLKKKVFPNILDYRKDSEIATHNCSVAYHVHRQIQDAYLKVNLIHSAVQTINQVVVTQLTAASKENVLISKSVHSMNNQFETMRGFHLLCNNFAKLVPEEIDDNDNDKSEDDIPEDDRKLTKPSFHESIKQLDGIYTAHYQEFKCLKDTLHQLKPSIDSLIGSRVQSRFLMNSWEQSTGKVKGVNDFLRVEKISSTLVSNISQSYSDICGEVTPVARRRAPEPEEQLLHLIERTKMIQLMERLEKLHMECFLYFTGLSSVLSDWYKGATTAYIQPEILTSNIKSLQEKIVDNENHLSEAVTKFNAQLQVITKSMSVFPVCAINATTENGNNSQIGIENEIKNKARKESVKAIRQRLHELALVQEEIQSNFKVNVMLCDQLQGLLSNSF